MISLKKIKFSFVNMLGVAIVFVVACGFIIFNLLAEGIYQFDSGSTVVVEIDSQGYNSVTNRADPIIDAQLLGNGRLLCIGYSPAAPTPMTRTLNSTQMYTLAQQIGNSGFMGLPSSSLTNDNLYTTISVKFLSKTQLVSIDPTKGSVPQSVNLVEQLMQTACKYSTL